jgi:hypothetical protein
MNAYSRGIIHESNRSSRSRARNEASFMWKHEQIDHGGASVEWGMKALQHYLNDPLGRQANERVRIDDSYRREPSAVLNSRSEHHQNHIPRLMIL